MSLSESVAKLEQENAGLRQELIETQAKLYSLSELAGAAPASAPDARIGEGNAALFARHWNASTQEYREAIFQTANDASRYRHERFITNADEREQETAQERDRLKARVAELEGHALATV